MIYLTREEIISKSNQSNEFKNKTNELVEKIKDSEKDIGILWENVLQSLNKLLFIK